MTRCLKCRQEFELDSDNCPHCNARLPPRFARWLIELLLPKALLEPEFLLKELLKNSSQGPPPTPAKPEHFRMTVERVVSLPGAPVAVLGRLEQGAVVEGQPATITLGMERLPCTVAGVVRHRWIDNSVQGADALGLILSGVTKDQVKAGAVISF